MFVGISFTDFSVSSMNKNLTTTLIDGHAPCDLESLLLVV